MDLMKNKLLVFEKIEFNGRRQTNITDYNIIPDIPEKYFGENYILEFEVDDDRLIESICFELYETTHYWDVLYALNNIRNSAVLPVNYDIVLLRTREAIKRWVEIGSFMVSKNLDAQYYDLELELDNGIAISTSLASDNDNEIVKRKYIELLELEVKKNEKFRKIKYISLSDMGELEAVLLTAKQSPKIDTDLIINIVETA